MAERSPSNITKLKQQQAALKEALERQKLAQTTSRLGHLTEAGPLSPTVELPKAARPQRFGSTKK